MDTKERDALIAKLLSQGMSLSDVQKHLEVEHAIKLTYMDLRLISADLNVDWSRQETAKPIPDLSEIPADDPPPSATQVNVSKVVRPGALFSGDVTFKSGARGEWALDRYGRLALNQAEGAAKPTEDDLQDFQVELQKVLQSKM